MEATQAEQAYSSKAALVCRLFRQLSSTAVYCCRYTLVGYRPYSLLVLTTHYVLRSS